MKRGHLRCSLPIIKRMKEKHEVSSLYYWESMGIRLQWYGENPGEMLYNGNLIKLNDNIKPQNIRSFHY